MNSPSNKKIIIIGAGLAGLSACIRLLEDGFDVEILEARNRYGGRVSIDNTMGFPISCGACWIHGDKANPMTLLAHRSQVQMAPVDASRFARFDSKGNMFSQNEILAFSENFQKLVEEARALAFADIKDISLSSALSHLMLQYNYSEKEKDFLKSQQSNYIEAYLGANTESLSARYWDHEEIWPGENCFLASTYNPIIENLAAQCNIRLNTVVNTVDMTDDKIQVLTDKASLQADAVIITVPLGVLKKKRITFYPCLPIDKLNAIQRLGMGLFNIITLKFPVRFWPSENDAMFFSQFDSPSIQTFFNLSKFIHQPILAGYYGGETASKLEMLTDEQLIEKVMINFRNKFGNKIPDPEAFIRTRWLTDPYSYGSYSYMPVGASPEDYTILAKPVANKLFFAGEATSLKYPATTHGAYLSGIREAEKVITHFNANVL